MTVRSESKPKTFFGTSKHPPREYLRIVYRRDDGKLWPRDNRGQIVSALPQDYPHDAEDMIDYARWIVQETVWSDGRVFVQESTFGGRWVTVHTVDWS